MTHYSKSVISCYPVSLPSLKGTPVSSHGCHKEVLQKWLYKATFPYSSGGWTSGIKVSAEPWSLSETLLALLPCLLLGSGGGHPLACNCISLISPFIVTWCSLPMSQSSWCFPPPMRTAVILDCGTYEQPHFNWISSVQTLSSSVTFMVPEIKTPIHLIGRNSSVHNRNLGFLCFLKCL